MTDGMIDTRVNVIETKKIYSGNLSLRLDKFRLNGKLISKEVVEHKPSVGIIPVTQDGDILLVLQYRHAAGKTILEIPAGKIEEGENPEQAALREMSEEIGRTGRLQKISQWYLAPGYDTELMHVFVATDLRKVEHGVLDDDENIIVEQISLEMAIKKCMNFEIQDCKSIAALLAYNVFAS